MKVIYINDEQESFLKDVLKGELIRNYKDNDIEKTLVSKELIRKIKQAIPRGRR